MLSALLHSIRHEIGDINIAGDVEPGCLTNADDRAISLVAMAIAKVHAMVDMIDPYV